MRAPLDLALSRGFAPLRGEARLPRVAHSRGGQSALLAGIDLMAPVPVLLINLTHTWRVLQILWNHTVGARRRVACGLLGAAASCTYPDPPPGNLGVTALSANPSSALSDSV